MFRKGLKPLLQVFLLFLFLFYFGIPAVERYQENETMVVTSAEPTDGIEAPAITIQAMWKDYKPPKTNIIADKCGQAENITECIINSTYSLKEIVLHAGLGYKVNKTLMNSELWTESFANANYGRSYTLKFNHRMGPDYYEDSPMLYLNHNLSYHIFVHDKRFFLSNENPLALPTVQRRFDPESSNHLFHLTLTETRKLNLPRKPCIQDSDYNFNNCVIMSLTQKVTFTCHLSHITCHLSPITCHMSPVTCHQIGCHLPWDLVSSRGHGVCVSLDQFR